MLKAKFMFTRKKWLSHLIILAIAAVPVMAANNDTKPPMKMRPTPAVQQSLPLRQTQAQVPARA